MQLLDLPQEILSGCILPWLDLHSLDSFALTSRAARAALHDLVYRDVVLSNGYDRPQTCSATGVSPALIRHWKPPYEEKELALVVAAQRSMSGYYDDVQSWEQYLRKRTKLVQRWREGEFREDSVKWALVGAPGRPRLGTWRFKLDPEARLIVTSGVMGGHQAWARDSGHRVWLFSDPLTRFPHVELSEGYLLTHISEHRDYFIVFRRNDIAYPPARYDPDLLASIVSIESRATMMMLEGSRYKPFAVFPAYNTRASKMRFPYFCAASDESAYVYHILDGTVRQISIADFNPEVFYVEMSDEHVFVAGDLLVSVYRFETGQMVGMIPPQSARELLDTPPPGEWTAIHHGRDLVAAHSSGYLLWAKHWRRAISASRQEAIELIRVLDIGRVTQLSVENDRAVFVVEHDGLDDNVNPRHSLWCLHLDEHATDDHLPEPRCLAFPLPTRYAPSRVECTTDEIYVSAQSAYLEGGPLHEDWLAAQHRKQAYRWRSVTGRVLYTHALWAQRDTQDDMSVSQQLDWMDTSEQTGDILFDAVAVYQFGF